MSTFLADKGISIQAGYKPENLPAGDAILVVGNTIKRGNPELEAAMDRETLLSLAARDDEDLFPAQDP